MGTTNVQHEKLVLKLVKPFIPDFSVAEEDGEDLNDVKLEDDVKENNVSPPKRKMKAEEAGSTKKNKKKNKK